MTKGEREIRASDTLGRVLNWKLSSAFDQECVGVMYSLCTDFMIELVDFLTGVTMVIWYADLHYFNFYF